YTEGRPTDDDKQKLDLYLPKDKKPAPVFLFIHGGAWRSGDRSQYQPLGNRFAKEGLLTIVPNYRLAPKDPHPAQIEDVAAAFAWTVRRQNNLKNFERAEERKTIVAIIVRSGRLR